jgi:hypothetical protein
MSTYNLYQFVVCEVLLQSFMYSYKNKFLLVYKF